MSETPPDTTDTPSFMGAMFASLDNANYRRYVSGQSVSLIGTWMQTVAQSWLVLELTGSGTKVGFVVALQTLPVLLLGPYAGVVADRVDKRRLMIWLQGMMGVLSALLGILTVTRHVTVTDVFILAVLLGLNNCFENPARQSFILEMVGADRVRNAVSLNAVMMNVARVLGPAAAGLIIAAGGIGLCFLINAASFVAVMLSLMFLDTSALLTAPPSTRESGQVRAGLAYVRRTPELAVPLLMMALVGCLAYEFQVVLPVVAKQTFHGGPETYGYLMAAMGVGAIIGGLYVAARGRVGIASMANTSFAFAVVLTAAALAPTLALELVALAAVGGVSVGFLSKGNSTLQLAASPAMRGRVMALWAVAFLGSTPIGGPIAGAVSEHFGGRVGLAMAAATCAVSGGLGLRAVRAQRARLAPSS